MFEARTVDSRIACPSSIASDPIIYPERSLRRGRTPSSELQGSPTPRMRSSGAVCSAETSQERSFRVESTPKFSLTRDQTNVLDRKKTTGKSSPGELSLELSYRPWNASFVDCDEPLDLPEE